MKVAEIAAATTTLMRVDVEAEIANAGTGLNGWHESLFRSYHCLQKVKGLLKMETPQSVILEMIELMGE